jgi:hypothetical protein
MSQKIDDRSTKSNKGFMTNPDTQVINDIMKAIKASPKGETTEERLMNQLPEMGVNQFFRLLGILETNAKIIRPSPGLVGLALTEEESEKIVAAEKQNVEQIRAMEKMKREEEAKKKANMPKPPNLPKLTK